MSLALTRFLAPLVPLALLAACGDEPAEDGERSASGEVLEGTISDAMLPLDQLQSEPPLLAPERAPAAREASGPGQPGGADDADEEETAPAEDDAAEELQAEEEPQAAAE
jgi:hypothetical protein